MNAFDNNIKPTKMPQQDADKDTMVLIGEIKTGVPGNFTAVHAKLDEIINNREIKNDDPDDVQIGGLNSTRGGVRPKHQPLVP